MPKPPFGKQDGRMASFYSFKTIIMRNHLLSLLVALLAVTGSLPVAAQEAYAVLTSNKTLTFYYDNLRATRQNYKRIYDMPRPGVFPAWAGNYGIPQKNIKHVVFDASFSRYRPTSTRGWFNSCIILQHIEGIRNLNTEKVTDMSNMFDGCSALTSLDVSNFNTKNVTNMSGMFFDCKSLTTIFCNKDWNVGYNVDGDDMFENCTKLKGTNTAYNGYKTGIEMANPTTGYFTSLLGPAEAYAVFTFDKTLTFYYDNLRATRPKYNIYDMPKPGESPAWVGNGSFPQGNIKHVVFDASFSRYRPSSTESWFAYCINLQDIEGIQNLNTENVTDMGSMFYDCKALTSLDVSNFNTENVTDMSWMFESCKALTSLNVSKFNTQNVTNMGSMFNGCQALTSLDVSKFNTQNVTDMSWMFASCEALTSLDVSNFNTQYVTDMGSMFNDCKALTSLDVSNFNTQNVTDMSWMFASCEALTSLDVSNFNTQYVTRMDYMFWTCEALTSLDVSNFNTQNVTDMSSMFYDCKALRWLHLSNSNTENVTDMSNMFDGCSALTSLDVSKFNTQNVTDMSFMFFDCTSLTTIFCNSDWGVGRYVNDKNMFQRCTKLKGTRLKGTNTWFNANKTGIEMANPTTGYFTSKPTGIDHVKTADRAGDGKIYDLSGSRVNESYKGIVIKNGKKYIQK